MKIMKSHEEHEGKLLRVESAERMAAKETRRAAADVVGGCDRVVCHTPPAAAARPKAG